MIPPGTQHLMAAGPLLPNAPANLPCPTVTGSTGGNRLIVRNYRSLTVPLGRAPSWWFCVLGNGADSAISPLTVAAAAAPGLWRCLMRNGYALAAST
jgi:hypothetical protein